MPCRISDGRQFDDGDIEVTIPEPLDLYYMLPNGLADILAADEIDTIHSSNRTYLAQIFHIDSEMGRTGDYIAAMDEIHKLLDEVRTRVGASNYAQEYWLKQVAE